MLVVVMPSSAHSFWLFLFSLLLTSPSTASGVTSTVFSMGALFESGSGGRNSVVRLSSTFSVPSIFGASLLLSLIFSFALLVAAFLLFPFFSLEQRQKNIHSRVQFQSQHSFFIIAKVK